MSNNTRFTLRLARDKRILFSTARMTRHDAKIMHDLLAAKFLPADGYTIAVIGVEPETSWTTSYATLENTDQ